MKIRCEVCGNIGYLQHIGKNYSRVRHYVSLVNDKPKFEYHKQNLEYISNIDLSGQDNIDLKVKDSSSISGNMMWSPVLIPKWVQV